MSIRTSLILSYLALIVLLIVAMLTGADWLSHRMSDKNVAFAEEGVVNITRANLGLAEEILSKYGEFLVEDLAQYLARELSYVLGGKKSYDYKAMRRNPALRRLAVQDILTPEGVAGYTDLIDKKGVAVIHPNPKVEGKNLILWKNEFPEMWQLVERSFKEPLVTGYYSFIDGHNKKRQKFMALAQVPRTPFILVAVVNIDEYFLPVQNKIQNAAMAVKQQANRAIKQFAAEMDQKVKITTLVGGVILSVVGILFGVFFAATISRPLRLLKKGVQDIGEGNFEVAVPEKGAREVVALAHAFNHLGQKLTEYIAKRDFIRDTFGRYVTKEVVQRLLESEQALALGGETREVTILLSDLRGFTALTADMTPERIIFLLNRYLGKMIEILVDYRAVIDEIQGDGLLAFFGAPEEMPDHPVQAVACALAMQLALEEINALNAADGLPHLEMGIGISSGPVVVGNIGSELRTKYSVVGSPVNLTSRIEGTATPGQVLISAETYSRVRDLVEIGEVLRVNMKGIPGQVVLYEVLGLGPPYNMKLKERQEALRVLAKPAAVTVDRIHNKVVVATLKEAWLTHISDTRAVVDVAGEITEWEDVRLQLLDATGVELPGRLYGKVTSLEFLEEGKLRAMVRFTSVSPEVHETIRRLSGHG